MRIQNLRYLLKSCILLLALSMSGVTAHAANDDEIIEFQGDRYVIHVDRMHPDSEMTLLDVLNTCPEFLSINGKKIDLKYKLRVDNIDLVFDAESFFANVKANKQLGKKCNLFAEFHDIAGYATGNVSQLTGLYQNRALSIGATIYPFRK